MLVSIAEACTDLEGRGRAEAVTAAKEACAIGKHEGEKRLEVMALLALASVHVAKGSRDKPGAEQALQAASEARELAQDLDDRRKEAESLHAMAEAKAICTSLEDALESADEAMDFYLELKDKRMEAFELLRMASWNLALGQHARALSDAEDALEIYQMLQSPKEVDALRAVFQAHLARSDLRKARLVAAEAFRRFREQGKKEAQVQACTMLIEMYVKADRIDEALSSAQQGLKVCKELGDQARQVSMLVVVARMRFRLAQLSKALVTGRDAFDLMLQLKGSDGKAVSKDKVDLMQVMADSHVNQGDPEAALELVTEMKEHFQQIEDGQGLASSLLLSSILQLRLGKADVATQLANRAQSLFNEEGDMKGEADALKTLGELYWKKSEFKAAVRMGERARALYREVEFTDGELACMYMISENAVRLSVQEGAKVREEPKPRAARDALEKGLKLAEAGLKMARASPQATTPVLRGALLCARAQALTLSDRFEDALRSADEAVLLFRDAGNYQLEANALMLSCDNLRATRQLREAAEAADEALTLYRHVADEQGIKLASDVLESLREHMQPTQQQQQPSSQSKVTPLSHAPERQQQGQAERQETAVAWPRGPAGPALNLSEGLSMEVVHSKIREIASRIVGADDGDIELDTPLMEAGLTSNSGILLRDELSKEIPGVHLPVTLVFDYPSISAMAELILQSTGSLKN